MALAILVAGSAAVVPQLAGAQPLTPETTESDIGERRQLVDFVFGVMLYKLAFAKIRLVALGGQIKCEPSI